MFLATVRCLLGVGVPGSLGPQVGCCWMPSPKATTVAGVVLPPGVRWWSHHLCLELTLAPSCLCFFRPGVHFLQ